MKRTLHSELPLHDKEGLGVVENSSRVRRGQ